VYLALKNVKEGYRKHKIWIWCFGGLLIVLFIAVILVNTWHPQQSRKPATKPHWQTYEELIRNQELEPAGKMLEIFLTYNRNRQPTLVLTNLAQKNDYIPKENVDTHAYTVHYLNTANTILGYYLFHSSLFSSVYRP
jgi:hypothetical protein